MTMNVFLAALPIVGGLLVLAFGAGYEFGKSAMLDWKTGRRRKMPFPWWDHPS